MLHPVPYMPLVKQGQGFSPSLCLGTFLPPTHPDLFGGAPVEKDPVHLFAIVAVDDTVHVVHRGAICACFCFVIVFLFDDLADFAFVNTFGVLLASLGTLGNLLLFSLAALAALAALTSNLAWFSACIFSIAVLHPLIRSRVRSSVCSSFSLAPVGSSACAPPSLLHIGKCSIESESYGWRIYIYIYVYI